MAIATLAETQQQLFHYLQGKASTIDRLVTGKSAAAIERRLLIYREAYQLRLTAHLAKQFPVLKACLHETAFNQLALAYLHAYPPTHFAIRHFGDQLSDFLAAQQDDLLAELATIEWQLNEIIDQAASAPLLTAAHLAHLTPETLMQQRFFVQAYVRIVPCHYDTPPWRDALKQKTKAYPKPLLLPAIKHYALWRKEFQTYYRPLSPLEASLMQAIQAGQNFADLCALALNHDPSQEDAAAQQVVRCLLTWIHDGWFSVAN